jgi:hypothetical protein
MRDHHRLSPAFPNAQGSSCFPSRILARGTEQRSKSVGVTAIRSENGETILPRQNELARSLDRTALVDPDQNPPWDTKGSVRTPWIIDDR